MNVLDIFAIKTAHFGSRAPTIHYAYNANNLVEYIGLAVRGTLTSQSAWDIYKFTYTGNFVILRQTAPVNSVWDDRSSLSYE
jgi:hypothetical protein